MDNTRESLSHDLSEKTREILALLFLAIALFAFLSTVSYTGADFYDSATKTTSSDKNLCGKTGDGLAKMMLHTFGYSCYALYLCIGLWGVILFVRKRIENVGPKVLGLLAFTLFTSALLSHFLEGCPPHLPDHGGLVGLFIDGFFQNTLGLGRVGAKITLVLLAMITFLLATDWMFYSSLVAFAEWIKARKEALEERRALAANATEAEASEDDGTQVIQEEGAAEDAIGPVRPMKRSKRKKKTDEDVNEGELTAASTPATPELPLPEEPKKQLLLDGEPEDMEDKTPRAIQTLLDRIVGTEDDPNDDEVQEEAGDREGTDEEVEAVASDEAPEETPADELADDGDPIDYSPPPQEAVVDYQSPGTELLDKVETVSKADLKRVIAKTSAKLEETLQSFKIDAKVVEIQRGPVITMFEMALAKGIKVDRIRALEDDIAMAVKAQNVRIVAPIPGKSTFGIEVPNKIRETVRLRELLGAPDFDDQEYALPIFLGKDAAGRLLTEDLAKMPHLLVAGATGSGKSVCLNTIIMSMLYTRTPEQTKLILVDPKMVELSSFKAIPHLMCPVVTDMKRASAILEWAVKLMDARYQLLSDVGVKNIYGYNKLGETEIRARLGRFLDEDKFSPVMPFIVIIVDELADLMMIAAKEVESFITRLAQKSRAVGIHLILATQRPSTNVITGLIKANMPTRIAFMVASKIDSRVILDVNGADKLLGQGDMLYIPPRSSFLARAQGAFVSEEEIRRVVQFLKKKGKPEYEEDLVDKKKDAGFDPFEVDDLYEEATTFMIETQRGSASLLQRRFAIGYTRASRLIDIMAQDGVLGEYKGSQAREVLLPMDEWEKRLAERRAKQKSIV